MCSEPEPEGDVGSVLAGVSASLAGLEGGIGLLVDADEARRVVAQIGEVTGRLHSVLARVTDQVETDGLFGADGHRNVVCWLEHVGRMSRAEASAVVATGRMMRACDQVAAAHATGRLGVDQARLVGRVHRNPRCGHLLGDHQEPLLAAASSLSVRDFAQVCRRWEQLADQDGARPANERRHEHRRFQLARQPDGSWRIDGTVGDVMGEAMNEVFEAFLKAQRLAETDDEALAARSEPQRRADTLFDIFQAAASTPADAQRPEPLVNLVADMARMEAFLAGNPDPGGRCETLDGHPIDIADAVAAALIGRIRRVVYDSNGAVIDLGRTSRLFRGAAADAVRLRDRMCLWPGCSLPAKRCQIDHTTPWAAGGRTDHDNGGLLCGRHNRSKQKGFRTSRDPTGRWRFYRPDGTQIE